MRSACAPRAARSSGCCVTTRAPASGPVGSPSSPSKKDCARPPSGSSRTCRPCECAATTSDGVSSAAGHLDPARQTGGVHLAQLNVGRLRAPLDSPMIDDFRNNLEPINALAEVSPGYVWRLQDEDGNATGIKVFDDDLEIINLSVWES